MAAAFIPATEVPTTRHRWASAVLLVALWRKYCYSNAGRSEFTGHGFVTTSSLTMKHGRNRVQASNSRCRNFRKNTIDFTESNKTFKTDLILTNKIVLHLERGTHGVKHLVPLFVLWKCCAPTQLYCIIPNYIFENIPWLESSQNSKAKITAITFGEECTSTECSMATFDLIRVKA